MCKGYTIIEVLVSLSIGFIIISLSYSFFFVQRNVEKNINLKIKERSGVRIFFHTIERDIKRANCNPLERENIGITKACHSSLEISYDLDEDGKISSDEMVGYGFAKKYDANQDGIADENLGVIGRKKGKGNLMPIAENIQSISFAYAYIEKGSSNKIIWAYDSDNDGMLDIEIINIDENIANEYNSSNTSSLFKPISIKNIIAVKVFILSILPKKSKKQISYKYVVGNKVLTGKDYYKRNLFSTLIKIR